VVGGTRQAALTFRDWLGVVGLGFSGYYLASFLDFAGLAYISASFERLILYLNPTLVLLFGWLLYRRRATRPQVLGMVVSYAGVLLVFGHELWTGGGGKGGGAAAWGAFLVFLSAVSYAGYLVYSGEFVKRLGSLRLVGLATTVACVLCILQFVLTRPISVALQGGARGHLAVGAQRHGVHGGACPDGHDGHRAHRPRGGRANRHDRAPVDHPHGGGHTR
jgi:drug/metabolite transporter (DMT)-like permease